MTWITDSNKSEINSSLAIDGRFIYQCYLSERHPGKWNKILLSYINFFNHSKQIIALSCKGSYQTRTFPESIYIHGYTNVCKWQLLQFISQTLSVLKRNSNLTWNSLQKRFDLQSNERDEYAEKWLIQDKQRIPSCCH